MAVLRTICLLLGVSPLLALLPASAQPAAPAATDSVRWERALPPLTITASRLPTIPAEAPVRVTVIDSAALARTGAVSVASALERRAGLFVRQYGAGGLATPALRGTGASQTALLLDGQPITDPQIGHLDLSLLPTVLLRSVEVMHGPASPVHGSDGLGGAIHLRTLQPHSSLRVRGTVHAGAFGERGGSILVGGPLSDRTTVLAAGDVQTTDGDFPYRDEARFPPATVRRQNADRTRRSVFGSVRSRVGNHRLRVSGWLTRAERGLPPSSSTAASRERQWDTQLRLWGRDRWSGDAGTVTVRGMAQHTRLRYANPARDLDQTGRTWTHSLEATGRRPLTAHWTGAAGLSGSVGWADHPKLNADAQQEHAAAFAEGTGHYGRLRLYPALRADAYWMPNGPPRTAVTPRLGANWVPVPAWPNLHLKAHVGRAFRVPTFNDRYWEPGGTPDLRPERSWGGDLGLRLDRSRGHAELTAFGHRRRDQIVWAPTGNGYWAPRNVGRVRALGLEAAAERAWALPAGLSLQTGFTYTLTDARNRSDPDARTYDDPLRYVPRHLAKAHSTIAWGPAALTLHLRYTGRRYVTSDGTQALEAYLLGRTRLRLKHSVAGVEGALSVQIDNALDTDYQSIGQRPMPPRHAQVRLFLGW
jgi:iron complex outermembrane receptor protein